MVDLSFYKGKKIFITGHTGFKGSWLCRILINAGAIITGYSLKPNTDQHLFEMADIENNITHIIGDIRNLELLKKEFDRAKPEIVFHLAAQPLVRESYKNPVYTYETNIIGTVNILECIRKSNSVKSFLNVTTDKVYKNNECEVGYKEEDSLDGDDPYSNSKSCSELVTHSYKNSFFQDNCVRISTARAGNVIGGGDFSKDRIIPDCIRASRKHEKIIVRNPNSIRPYEHVLEALFAYLMIAKEQYNDKRYEGYYNIGPNEENCITTRELVELFCKYWGENQNFEIKEDAGPHEARFLKLDCSKVKKTFHWKPTWKIEKAVQKTVEFEKAENKVQCMNTQIEEFIEDSK